MKKIVAIGGVDPNSTLDVIEKEIIKLSNKKNSKVLYLPTAGGDDSRNYNLVKEIFETQHGCKVDVLFLIKNNPTENEIRDKVFSSDIIYVGGGSVSVLMKYFKKFSMDKILKEAYEKEIVLAGISAGAICWGRHYYKEKRDLEIPEISEYIKIDCLNFLEFNFCPHYNNDEFVKEFDKIIKEKNLVGIALDNNCAIEFVDDKYRVITSSDDANAYKVNKQEIKIIKEVILKDSNFRSIDELMVLNEENTGRHLTHH